MSLGNVGLVSANPFDRECIFANSEKLRSDRLGDECEVRAMKYIPGSVSADFLSSALFTKSIATLKTKAALIGWLGLMLSSLIPTPVLSQQIGDAEKGKQYALEFCTGCHAVQPEQPLSPLPKAPRFEDVANTPGMTAISLTAWFQTSHPTMPNIVMTDAQMRNVIQYILSLKSD
jgi:mono/diheme cytochrome c family protein